jgi:hypothetical protein
VLLEMRAALYPNKLIKVFPGQYRLDIISCRSLTERKLELISCFRHLG